MTRDESWCQHLQPVLAIRDVMNGSFAARVGSDDCDDHVILRAVHRNLFTRDAGGLRIQDFDLEVRSNSKRCEQQEESDGAKRRAWAHSGLLCTRKGLIVRCAPVSWLARTTTRRPSRDRSQ